VVRSGVALLGNGTTIAKQCALLRTTTGALNS